MVEVNSYLMAACSCWKVSCKRQQIYAPLSGGGLFVEGQGLLNGRFRMNIRKVFIRNVVKHGNMSSMETGEFLVEIFEIQTKLWLI